MAACGGTAGGGAVGPVPPFPTGADIAYVVNGSGVVSFNLITHAVGRPITEPLWKAGNQVLVTADRRTAFVETANDDLVPLNLVTGRFGAPILRSLLSEVFAVTPNGRTIYVTDARRSNTIVAVDTRTGVHGRTIHVPGGPVGMSIAPDGVTAYVLTAGDADITPVNLATGAVGNVIQVPNLVRELAIAPGGAMAYAAGAGDVVVGKVQYSYVTPINLAEGVAEAPIPLHHDPYGIALTPDGRTAYVTGGGGTGPPIPPDLTAIDLASGKVSGTFSVPGGANDIVNATSGAE